MCLRPAQELRGPLRQNLPPHFARALAWIWRHLFLLHAFLAHRREEREREASRALQTQSNWSSQDLGKSTSRNRDPRAFPSSALCFFLFAAHRSASTLESFLRHLNESSYAPRPAERSELAVKMLLRQLCAIFPIHGHLCGLDRSSYEILEHARNKQVVRFVRIAYDIETIIGC